MSNKKFLWKIEAYKFSVIYAVVTLFLFNLVFFRKAWKIYPNVSFICGMSAVIASLLMVGCAILFWKHTTKPLAILLTMINAGVFYFIYSYNIAFDKVMLLNVLETDFNEVKSLLSPELVMILLLMGVIPSCVIYKTEIIYQSGGKELMHKLCTVAVALIAVVAIVGSGYKSTAQFLRNNKYMKYYLIPVNYFGAVVSVAKIKLRSGAKDFVKIAEDAKVVPYWQDNGKKNLFVFVVGETARSDNFSLNGYNKPTNAPLLKYKNELLSFNNVYSCGTSTAISVPCIFAKEGRKNFKKERARHSENLTDVAQKNGYKVWWRGNMTGCKGICARVESEILCKKDSCLDDILIDGLSAKLRQQKQDMFVVLHQIGSHGPTYYKRYPEGQNVFKPTCKTERLDKCSQEEIVNVYDNTIYYTSQNLAKVIATLKEVSDEYNAMMIYVSDHGESLGENNIYLHAAPYMIAPIEQRKVPMIVWFDDEFAGKFKLDRNCLQNKIANEFSHDNIFHSFVGMMGIKTKDYQADLDIFAQCRK